MESFLNRYRNITVLLLVVFGQLVLLAYQVRSNKKVPAVRFWTVTAITPVARILEGLRGGSIGVFRNYFVLRDAANDNRRLREENNRLKIENTFLRNDLNRADRAEALKLFQKRTPSRMLAATVIATGSGPNSKVVFVDRGSVSGVMRGMAVVTPDGVVGKIEVAYPMASEVLLITDRTFAAGVVAQKSQVRGTLKGQDNPVCRLDYVPPEDKIEAGERLYTSGDDRIFPRGFEVGVVKAVRPGQPFQEILVAPSGMQRGLEDVLILLTGEHQEIPANPGPIQPVFIAPPPPASAGATGSEAPTGGSGPPGTEADRLRSIYQAVGEAQNHKFGEGLPGSKPPDFTRLPSTPGGAAGITGVTAATGSRPAGVGGATGGSGNLRPPGATGSTAATGSVRPPVATGSTAATGAARPPGATGSTAATGGVRLPGATGSTAATGSVRLPGPTGSTASTGVLRPLGATGSASPTGSVRSPTAVPAGNPQPGGTGGTAARPQSPPAAPPPPGKDAPAARKAEAPKQAPEDSPAARPVVTDPAKKQQPPGGVPR